MYTCIYITASSTSMTWGHLTNLFTYQQLQARLCQLWEGTALCEPAVTLRSLLKQRWFPPECENLTRPCVITYKLMEQICVSIWKESFTNGAITNPFFIFFFIFILNIWKDHIITWFIQGFSLSKEDLATLARKMRELPHFEAILLAVLYTHTQMGVWL